MKWCFSLEVKLLFYKCINVYDVSRGDLCFSQGGPPLLQEILLPTLNADITLLPLLLNH